MRRRLTELLRAVRGGRAALWVAVALAWVGLNLGAALYAPRAHGQRLTDVQEEVVRLYVKTRLCMRSAGTAAWRRRLPYSDAAHVQHFMVTVCGDPLRTRLQADGMPEEDARTILVRMSRTAYYQDVLGVPEPHEPNS